MESESSSDQAISFIIPTDTRVRNGRLKLAFICLMGADGMEISLTKIRIRLCSITKETRSMLVANMKTTCSQDLAKFLQPSLKILDPSTSAD